MNNNCYGYYTQSSYCNPMGDCNMIKDIEEYIKDEMSDSRYYAELACKAPTQRAKDIIIEFSKDEQTHARNFMNAYFMLTGKIYNPPPVEEPDVPEYMEALKRRILAETTDYKKYGEKYLLTCNPVLKNLFFMTRTAEAQHAMRMPLLMAEEVEAD